MKRTTFWLLASLAVLSMVLFTTVGCRSGTVPEQEQDTHEQERGEKLTLPELRAADLGDAPLKVVATTSIIGDVVAQVGRRTIELTTLIGPGQDPHSYEPTPQDMATASKADVIFVNGWDLEEALIRALEDIVEDVPLVPVSAHIEPLAFERDGHEQEEAETEHGQDEEHRHAGADPHTWFSVHNVEQWVQNIEHVLSALDPAHAGSYQANAEAYKSQLRELDAWIGAQLAQIPEANRKLVTDHTTFSYFAHQYGFDQIGAVFPGYSTLDAPSARERATLEDAIRSLGIKAIFVSMTVNPDLAERIAEDTGIRLVSLYTGSLSEPGGPADSYLALMRYNVSAIVEALSRPQSQGQRLSP